MPYWGNVKDRTTLRKFWNPKNLYKKDAPFHVVISSYGILLEDEKMFQKIKWQYLVLDEAHSIKSIKSQRWQSLVSLDVRNRLLLTGTPLQNNMAELWALLHFIMPSLFDSHEEFNEWFSKDIESHAKKTVDGPTSLNEQQVQRLHMILKPFMLRRVKKDVMLELAPKTEKTVYCELSYKQKVMYQQVKDIFKGSKNNTESSLANYVMQFRKICNHPDLFEKLDVESPYQWQVDPMAYRQNFEVTCLNKNPIELKIPKVVFRDVMQEEETKLPNLFSIYDSQNMKNNATFDFVPSIMKKSLGEVEWLSKASPLELGLYYSTDEDKKMIPDIQIPHCLETHQTKVLSPPIDVSCSDRSFGYKYHDATHDEWTNRVLNGFSLQSPQPYLTLSVTSNKIIPDSEKLEDVSRFPGTSFIRIPSFEDLILSSGKLQVLDTLLVQLSKEGAKVCIFSQMTKMLNILEDLMHYRGYKFLRLDGSTAISDRNEMVKSFQTRPDIFVFLLSTRAGGLGINLTAGNTVIFYDSDWNPTSDSQAMDRCHRIGQTRPVTVYRLVTRNTIDERILEIAHQKSMIQETVYSGTLEPLSNTKEVMMKLLE